MSAVPSQQPMRVVRGATWVDEFVYTDENGVGIDLTGYEARMQVRTTAGQYGTTTADTLLLDLTHGDQLSIDVPVDQTVPCRVRIRVDIDEVALLNADNVRRIVHCYALEVFDPNQIPEYVIPLAAGKVNVFGETSR